MSRNTNTAAIGAFVLGALVLIVAGILIFGSGRFFTKTSKHVLFFDSSVNGLSLGAPVNFKGVRVGSVSDINLLFDPRDLSFKIMVLIETNPGKITPVHINGKQNNGLDEFKTKDMVNILIEKGLRAQLGMQSLVTGQLYINLDFYPNTPSRLVGLDERYIELPTIPSSLEQLSKTMENLPTEEIAAKLVAALNGIERIVNSPELPETISSLSASAKSLQEILQSIGGKVSPVAANLEQTLGEARKLLAGIDKQIGPLGKELTETVKDTKTLVKNMDGRLATVSSSLEHTLKATQSALLKAENALSSIDGALGEQSDLRYELAATLKGLSAASRSMRTLTDYLERYPESVIRGKSQ